MYKFEVEFFDHIEWERMTYEILAEDENQVKAWVDSKRALEFRLKPYNGQNKEDSLTITKGSDKLTLPIVLREY